MSHILSLELSVQIYKYKLLYFTVYAFLILKLID